MKLVYVKWKEVQKLVRELDDPEYGEFEMVIRCVWQRFKTSKLNKAGGRWIYEVELPVELIT